MTIEGINNNKENKLSENAYAEDIIQKVDDVISKVYNIINGKDNSPLHTYEKVEELYSLRDDVTKTIIRLGGNDIDTMPSEYPGTGLAIVAVVIYDFLKGLGNENLPKLKYRLESIDRLAEILEKKEDYGI